MLTPFSSVSMDLGDPNVSRVQSRVQVGPIDANSIRTSVSLEVRSLQQTDQSLPPASCGPSLWSPGTV